MIKILKEGKLPKRTKNIYKATCKNCGCEFEFEIEDCKCIERGLYGTMTVICPCCLKDITQASFKYRVEEVKDNE